MGFFNRIFYKIWIPFTISLIVGAAVFIVYYPNKLSSEFIESKKAEYRELTKTVALSVEIALNSEDFANVKKSIEFISLKQDLDYCAVLIIEDSSNVNITKILACYPENVKIKDILNKDPNKYLYTTQKFKSNLISGEIEIRASKKKINATINELIKPVYYSLGIIIFISVVIFYFFAKRLSSPIHKLIKITQELNKGVYDSRYTYVFEKDEIGVLSENILELQDKLNVEQKLNKELRENLENDVQERTKELEKVGHRLVQAQRISKIGHVDYLLTKKKLLLSEMACEVLGIEYIDEIDINYFINLISINYQKEISDIFSTNGQKINNINKDVIIKRKQTNEEHWISIIMEWTINQDGQLELSGTIQDITDRKNYEREIQQLSLVAKYTSNCVVITNKNKKILWVNDSLLELSGYKLEEIVGKSPKLFQFEKTNMETVALINQSLERNQKISGVEILNRGKYGNEYWLELNIVPINDEFGELNGYIAVETNITEKKKSTEEQSSLLSLTQLQNERLQNFAYIVSHNLRSHTVNIKSLMDIFLIEKPDLKEFELTNTLQNSIDSLKETIEHLTDIAQIIDNKNKTFESVNLHRVISKSISNVSSYLVNSDIAIVNNVSADIYVQAISTYLDSIILNLLTNAIKYRDKDKKSFVKLNAEVIDKTVRLTVVDNGLGIDLARNGRKLFGMYKTFHNNPDAKGIGLFITKNQVEAIGGKISIESELNIGTTFIIDLKYEN